MKIISCLGAVAVAVVVFCGCKQSSDANEITTVAFSKETNKFFQYNVWAAFVNRVFDGSMTVAALQEKGDIGLGSFDMLDGELVMLDGVAYRIREDGVPTVGEPGDEIVYADAAFFAPDTTLTINEALNFDSLRSRLNARLTSLNHFHAITVHGVFDSIKLGGVPRQSPPFAKGLDVLIPERPVFDRVNISGTMVGFYCPSFIGDINAAGYHFHFISDDKQSGGHVMAVQSSGQLNIAIDKLTSYEFRMPESAAFDTVRFDRQFQYNKK